MPIKGKEGQQQVGHELAHVEGDGPIHRKLSVYGVGGVLSDHEAASVHVTMQQGLPLLHKLGLQATEGVALWCCLFSCNIGDARKDCLNHEVDMDSSSVACLFIKQQRMHVPDTLELKAPPPFAPPHVPPTRSSHPSRPLPPPSPPP